MKKIFLAGWAGLFAAVLVPSAQAAPHSVPVMNARDMRFIETPNEGTLTGCDSFLAEFGLKIQDKGLNTVAVNRDPKKGIFILEQFNGIFATPSLEKSVLLKFRIKLSDPTALGKLLKTDDGYVYTQITSGGVPYALFFNGFSKKETIELVVSAQVAADAPVRSLSVIKRMLAMIVPPAHASESAAGCTPRSSILDAIGENEIMMSQIAVRTGNDANSIIWGCTKAAYDSTIGMAVGTIKGAWHLVTDFSNTVSKMHQSATQAMALFRQIKENISGVASQAYGSFKNLDTTTQAEIICNVIAMVPMALKGIFQAGKMTADLADVLANASKEALEKLAKEPKYAALLKKSEAVVDKPSKSASVLALDEPGPVDEATLPKETVASISSLQSKLDSAKVAASFGADYAKEFTGAVAKSAVLGAKAKIASMVELVSVKGPAKVLVAVEGLKNTLSPEQFAKVKASLASAISATNEITVKYADVLKQLGKGRSAVVRELAKTQDELVIRKMNMGEKFKQAVQESKQAIQKAMDEAARVCKLEPALEM